MMAGRYEVFTIDRIRSIWPNTDLGGSSRSMIAEKHRPPVKES